MTKREAKYVKAVIAGENKTQAALKAGWPMSTARCATNDVETPEMKQAIAETENRIAETVKERAYLTAIDLQERLSDEISGDYSECFDPLTGEPLPIHKWPPWARRGGVEFVSSPNMVHSADEAGSSWDQVGRKMTIQGKSRVKQMELYAKLKTIAALVNPNDKLGEGLTNLAGSIDRAISEGRQRAAARNRVIDVTPEEK